MPAPSEGHETDPEKIEDLCFTGRIYVRREGRFAVKRHMVFLQPELEKEYGTRQQAINELEVEKQIYRYLGPYAGIVEFCDEFSEEHDLWTVYVSPGDLRKYLQLSTNEIDQSTQLRWCTMMARTINFVHGKRVLIGDVRTPNWVVAEDGSIKLLDFGTSEIWPEGIPLEEVEIAQFTIAIELGMLGAVFYEVVTRTKPDYRVENSRTSRARLPPLEETPSLEGVFLGDIIGKLWTGHFRSAVELLGALEEVAITETG